MTRSNGLGGARSPARLHAGRSAHWRGSAGAGACLRGV